MTGRLEGRTALVTGAATGMGAATAVRFAREGAHVILFGHGSVALDEVAHACNGIAIHGDVTRADDIARTIEACAGRLDILVNAAGKIILDEPENIRDDEWERLFAINLTGTMAFCRAGIPLLKVRGGAVINIASVAAFNASFSTTTYAATKAAVVSYTRSLAYAHGSDNIRANVVAPGWVRTPMSEWEMEVAAREAGSSREAEFQALTARIALRRVAEPHEIAACCLFLASDDASFVTGTVLVADGGGRSPTQNRAV